MKDHYWDFRVCRWVRCTTAAPVEDLVPGQRSDEPVAPAEPVAPVGG
jgi:hypothetical protein